MSSRVGWGLLRAPRSGLLGPLGRRAASGPGRSSMNVFNREMKKKQKNWAASLQDGHQYDYLRDQVPPGQTPG